MSAFLTDLDARVITDDRAVLLAPLIYKSDLIGLVSVPAGFVTDWASVPRLPFAYMVAGGYAKAPAVVHDYLYDSKICTRAEADAVFNEAMALTGHPWWRRNLMWAGVRMFGWLPYGTEKEPHEAPPPVDHSPGA